MRKNIQTYKKVDVESNVIASDPHRIISLLYNGIFENLAKVKGAIQRKDLAAKSMNLTKAINIFRALEDALDFEKEPKISENFHNLYEYCIAVLSEVSVSLELKRVDEVVDLLKPLSDAWQQMPEQDKEEGLQLLKRKEAAS